MFIVGDLIFVGKGQGNSHPSNFETYQLHEVDNL